MGIRFRFDANLDPLERAKRGLQNAREIAQRTGQEVVREIEPQLVADLFFKPGKAKYPIQWTSEKQRRAFFASDGFGKGIPTKRTGALSDAWVVTFLPGTGAFAFRVRIANTNPASKYVFGTLARQLSRAARSQQGFHKTTGWPLASPIVQFWLQESIDLWRVKVADELAQEMGVTIKGRAFTGARR